jgi:cell division protein ZapA (FtsZ GTPase activity inhibitor)
MSRNVGRDEPVRHTVQVRIAGEDHVLRSTADPERTRACAALLDERIREIRERAGPMDSHRAVLLAALAISGGYLEAVAEAERLRGEVERQVEELTRRIDALLAG